MKLLVIHEVGYLNKPVYEYQDFAERLAALGHEVTVIDFDECAYGGLQTRLISKTGLSKIKLISLPHLAIPILGILWAKYQYPKVLRQLLGASRFDAILVYSVFINGTNTIDIAREYGVPVVYRVLDAYHRLRNNRLQSWLLLQGEKKIYKSADALLVTNARMVQYVKSLTGPRHAPCAILDHGVDTLHFRRLHADVSLFAKLGIDSNAFVGVFLGTTYSFSRLEKLIDNIHVLRKEIPNFVLLIVGGGESDASIREAILANNAQNFVFPCGMIDYEHLPDYLSLASIALCPFEINNVTREIIPIKILQYLASALPVISSPLPDVMQHFPQSSSGVFYSQADTVDSIVMALINLCSSDFKAAGLRGRDFVEKNYSINAAISKLESILRNPKVVANE